MDERAHRVGKNEAVFRAVNEEIERLTRGIAEISDKTLHIVCECGDLLCEKQLVVPLTRYEEVRADASCFLILPGHEKPSVEDVVDETPRYSIVRKHREAAQIAHETNPRAESERRYS
jgi:hypothetical protein